MANGRVDLRVFSAGGTGSCPPDETARLGLQCALRIPLPRTGDRSPVAASCASNRKEAQESCQNRKEGLFFMSNFSVKPLVYAGVSVALAVLFSYVFAIQTIFVRITFGFLPIAIYGAMYGPMKAGLVAAAADFIGTTLLGTSIFFPGFLVSGFLTGYIYGWFFYRKRITLRRACVPFFLVMVFIHLGLNTFWLTVFYHKAASAIFLSRLIKNLLCYPMEVGLFLAVYRPLLRFLPEQFPQPEASRPAPSTGA